MSYYYTQLVLLIFVCWVLEPHMSRGNEVISPHCQQKCGNIDIPWPFGIGDGCFFKEHNNITNSLFEIHCNQSSTSLPTPILGRNLELENISILEGELRIKLVNVSYKCYNQSGFDIDRWWQWLNLASSFTISSAKNNLIAIGCDTYAWYTGYRHNKMYKAGCMTQCVELNDAIDGECSGIGCCQSPLPIGLKNVTIKARSFSNHMSVYSFNPCSVAFPVAKDAFTFYKSNLTQNFSADHKKILPIVLNWSIGLKNCSKAKEDGSCLCKQNAECYDMEYESGYRCKCKHGYAGNPYMPRGCIDIDECKQENDCEKAAYCYNTAGSYYCKCPKGYHGDGLTSSPCTSNKHWLAPVLVAADVAFEQLERKYPDIMNAMSFAQMAAESRRKRAQLENTPLPPPPMNSKNKRLPEEVQPISSGATGSSGSPSTQPSKRQKPLLPKGDISKMAAGVSGTRSKGKEVAVPEGPEYEITRRDVGVVHCSDVAFSDLTPKDLRVRWRKAMGQLVSDKDLTQLASVPAKTRVNEILALQAELNIRTQFEITTAIGSEALEADLRASQKRVDELNAKLVHKNDQVMSLTRENKGLRHSLDRIHGKCRFLKEAILVSKKQLSQRKRMVKEWLETAEGQQFMAKSCADSFSQGIRVKELMLQRANEKAENKMDLESLYKAGEEEYEAAVQDTAEEMKELEALGPDDDEETERAAWEEALPSDLIKKFDVDFESYDISIPSRPPTPQASPIQAVPLIPAAVTSSPVVSGGVDSAGEGDVEEEPHFSLDELLED